MKINGHYIGEKGNVYIIAEMSANHGQSYDYAVKIMKAAKAAGADAVKVQTYTADSMTLSAPQPHFRVSGGTLWDGKSLHELYDTAHMPWEWQPKLQEVARDLGIDFFSSAFDESSVDFLEKMNVPAYKVASFEIIDIPLIERIAKTKKPIILSTGMSTLEEISEAVAAARSQGGNEIALLKCTSAYPAPPEEMNLKTIRHLGETFQLVAGLSDHSLGIAIPIAAVALGARIIEKHFTLSRSDVGPDSAFSLEPAEFKAMVDAIRITEKALGEISYETGKEEAKSKVFRRSLYATKDIKEGERITAENIRALRPGNGLPPKHYQALIGRVATVTILKGTPLSWEQFAEPTGKKRKAS